MKELWALDRWVRAHLGRRIKNITVTLADGEEMRFPMPLGEEPAPPVEAITGVPAATAMHSPDYRSVSALGRQFNFSATQADVIKLLWQRMEQGIPEVHHEELARAAFCESGQRLRDIFRTNHSMHPAWGTLIVVGTTARGMYRLRLSESDAGEDG
jgi:hypothetical protein